MVLRLCILLLMILTLSPVGAVERPAPTYVSETIPWPGALSTWARLINDGTNNGTFKWLEGQLDGTSFTIELKGMEGMSHYPQELFYGHEPHLVWVTSYYRYYSGVTLVDVRSGTEIRGYYGYATEVSPDGKRVAYSTQNNVYGLMESVMVDSQVLFPFPTRDGNYRTSIARMELLAPLHWETNNCLLFLILANGRAAKLAEDEELQSLYLVEATWPGDEPATGTVALKLWKLTAEQEATFKKQREAHSYSIAEFRTGEPTGTDPFKVIGPDVFEDPRWSLLPSGAMHDEYSTSSETGDHLLTVRSTGCFTDTHSGVKISYNNVEILGLPCADPSNSNSDLLDSLRLLTARLVYDPDKNTHVQQVYLQGNWLREAILGDPSETKYYLVTAWTENGEVKSTRTTVTATAISKH